MVTRPSVGQSDLLATIREIEATVQNIQWQTEQIIQSQEMQPTPHIHSTDGYGYIHQSMIFRSAQDPLGFTDLGYH